MKASDTSTQLGYCTNIHAAEEWKDMHEQLSRHLPKVRTQVSSDESLGLGLRVSASALASLRQPQHFEELQQLLSDQYHIFTINGFPYGVFHNSPVKEQVYSPDWSDPARLSYSNQLADLLASVLPENELGTISTVPGTFKDWMPGRIEKITQQLLDHVVHLVQLQDTTGKEIMMTLEPEPCCMLETIAETVDYFTNHLYSTDAIKYVAAKTGHSLSDTENSVRQHMGVCYDVCHAAVEYENPDDSIKSLQSAGIPIGKLQISSALRIPEVSSDTVTALKPFDEPVYLHQVIQNKNGELTRYVDLQSALADIDQAIGSEWRCHFHVPVFLQELQDFSTTQNFLKDILAIQKETPFTQHLEIETYTWDVLPAEYRKVELSSAIARELQWVINELQ